ncbi:unnamed protein product [Arctogadus glacialis]
MNARFHAVIAMETLQTPSRCACSLLPADAATGVGLLIDPRITSTASVSNIRLPLSSEARFPESVREPAPPPDVPHPRTHAALPPVLGVRTAPGERRPRRQAGATPQDVL